MKEKPAKPNPAEIDYSVIDSAEITVFKAGNGKHPIGCVHLDKRTGEIFGLIVSSDYRRKGVATELLNRVEDYASNHFKLPKIWSWTTPLNTESSELFRKRNYRGGLYWEK